MKFFADFNAILPQQRRSPCGERGLKFLLHNGGYPHHASLPVRGAWIEITPRSGSAIERASLPVRGAWIEMRVMIDLFMCNFVAPRAGSVD